MELTRSARTIRGLRLHPSGAVDVVTLDAQGRDPDLDKVRQVLGCRRVERSFLGDGLVMWSDEDGLHNSGEPNSAATAIARGFWRAHGASEQWLHDFVNYVGTTLLLGESGDLPPNAAALLVHAGVGVRSEHVDQLGQG